MAPGLGQVDSEREENEQLMSSPRLVPRTIGRVRVFGAGAMMGALATGLIVLSMQAAQKPEGVQGLQMKNEVTEAQISCAVLQQKVKDAKKAKKKAKDPVAKKAAKVAEKSAKADLQDCQISAACGTGTVWSAAARKCQASPATCETGMLWNADTYKCQARTPPAPALESCDTPVKTNPTEQSRKYSSIYDDDAIGTGHARSQLDSPQAWSAARSVKGEWMQIDLGAVMTVTGVVTQPRGPQNVLTYTVKYRSFGSNWIDMPGTLEHGEASFPSPIVARYVRLVAQSWVGHISMRAGVLACSQAERLKKVCPEVRNICHQVVGQWFARKQTISNKGCLPYTGDDCQQTTSQLGQEAVASLNDLSTLTVGGNLNGPWSNDCDGR